MVLYSVAPQCQPQLAWVSWLVGMSKSIISPLVRRACLAILGNQHLWLCPSILTMTADLVTHGSPRVHQQRVFFIPFSWQEIPVTVSHEGSLLGREWLYRLRYILPNTLLNKPDTYIRSISSFSLKPSLTKRRTPHYFMLSFFISPSKMMLLLTS